MGDLLDDLSNDPERFRGAIEHGLTYALVVNPIACGFCFIAFLFSLGGTPYLAMRQSQVLTAIQVASAVA